HLAVGAGRGGRCGRLDEVRGARRGAALARLPPVPASRAARRRGLRARHRRALLDPPARAVALRRRADVLAADARLPDLAGLAVLALGLGPVPGARHPRPARAPGRARGGRARALGAARRRAAPEGAARARGADGGAARRRAARADALVLPLPALAPAVRAARAPAAPDGPCARLTVRRSACSPSRSRRSRRSGRR